MLLNLLPGLRELRTPLACGYVWLLSFWLGMYDKIPPKSRATGLVKMVFDLTDYIGKPATIGVVSFAAFVVGSLVEFRAASLALGYFYALRFIRRKLGFDAGKKGEWRALVSVEGHNALVSYLVDVAKVEGVSRVRYSWLSSVVVAAVRMRHQLATELHLESGELYGDFDRKAAEADFRVNLALTLMVTSNVSVLAGFRWGWVGLPLGLALVQRGLQCLRAANDVLMQAIIAGKVGERVIEECKAVLHRRASSPTLDE